MAQSQSDFIVTRKRKRQAVDPCLGFYTSIAPKTPYNSHIPPYIGSKSNTTVYPRNSPIQAAPPIILNEQLKEKSKGANDSEFPLSLPSKSRVPSVPSSGPESDDRMLTVEDFLKRSVAPPARKYGHRKRNIRRVLTSSPESGNWNDSVDIATHTMSSNSCSPSHSPGHPFTGRGKKSERRKRLRRKPKKSLAERLIQASLLSHGDPMVDLLSNGTLANRRSSLNFEPVTQAQMPNRRWTLVDPRKSTPFFTASFISRQTSRSPHQPLSNWMPRYHVPSPPGSGDADSNLLVIKKRKTQRGDHKIQQVSRLIDQRRIPLKFVPLYGSEERINRIVENPSHRQGRAPTSHSHQAQTKRVPSARGSATCSSQIQFLASTPASNSNPPHPSRMTYHLETHCPEPAPAVSLALPENPKPISLSPPSLSPNAGSNIGTTPMGERTSSKPPLKLPDQTHPDHVNKSLKPLASFMNTFMETVRIATASSVNHSQSNLTSAGPARKVRRNAPARSSIATTSSTKYSRHRSVGDHNLINLGPHVSYDLECAAANTDLPVPGCQEISPPPTRNLQVSSSDIMTTLESREYRVILSSPSDGLGIS
ncbi:hypothetical protein BD779DRAFT_1495429 [Infundibulicybe gibba]|nr:hypothetical protein BD779DRAFT_1495429 [Infundibulicybe gibba]